jgi:hypothetical protein
MKYLIALLYFSHSYASLVRHETINSHLADFSYKEVCETMKAKVVMLSDASGPSEIECFNEKIKVFDFCLKKLSLETPFTRGMVIASEKKVYCESASDVIVSLDCDSSKSICDSPKLGCLKIKKLYAYRHELNHFSVIDKKINCYYSTKDTGISNELE